METLALIPMAAAEGGFNPLDLAGNGGFFWTLIIFLVALAPIWIVVMKPVTRALLERDAKASEAIEKAQQFPPEFTNIDYAEWQLRQFEANGEAVRSRFDTIYACCLHAVRQGFFAALMRYADELKGTAEAKALEKARASAAKASAAKSKKAAPRREAIRARYLELKKTKSKKTNRLTTLEAEFKVSSRHLQRIVKGLD